MCLRWIPSNVAPIASIAPRDRSFSASVFSSTRRQPHASNAWREHQQLRLDVDAAAPGGRVQPRPADLDASGAPDGARGTASSRPPPSAWNVTSGRSRPAAARASASSIQASSSSRRLRLRDREPAPRPRVARRLPEAGGVTLRQRLEPNDPPLERRCLPARCRSRHYTTAVPIYEYACMECEDHFEELVRSSEQVVDVPELRRGEGAQAALVVRGARLRLEAEPRGRLRRAAAVAAAAAAAAATTRTAQPPQCVGLGVVSGRARLAHAAEEDRGAREEDRARRP